MNLIKLLLFSTGLIFTSLSFSQVVRYVGPAGSNSNSGLTEADAFATIQFAINSSVNGDSVIVYPGTYLENINFNGKNITVSSQFATTNDTTFISSTIIDGGANGIPVVLFMNGETTDAKLIGLTIQNGLSALNEEGAGIHIGGWYTSPTLSNLIVQNNHSVSGKGGGIHANAYYSSPVITSCIIRNNTSSSAGGGIAITSAEPLISKCEIYNNSAPGNGSAIGHHANTSDLAAEPITNCLIYENIGPSVIAGTSVVLLNSTLVGNNGSINVNGSSCVLNSIIGTNTPINSQAQLNIKNSIISSGLTSVSVPLQVYLTTSNVLQIDPAFNNANTDDYSLKNYSPGIGFSVLSHTVGSNTYTSPTQDLFNVSRPNPTSSLPDLGAIESQYAFGSPYLTSITGGNTEATITWNIVSHPSVTKYRIFMSQSPIPDNATNGVIVDNIPQAVNTYLTNGLTNLTTYYFRIQSGDNLGNWSGMSNELTVTPSEPPSIPSISSALKGPRRAFVEWTPSTSIYGPVVYDIYRGTNLSSMTMISDNQVSTTYIDLNLTENTEFFYKIVAFNIYGAASDFSEPDSVTPNRIWYLSPTGSNNAQLGFFHLPLSTMTYANGMAIANDTIILKNGTYAQSFSATKSMTIGSLMITDPLNTDFHINNTILDGESQGMLIQNNQNYLNRLDLIGFTIQNCPGAVIEYNSGANSKISHLRLINNGNPGAQVVNIFGNSVINDSYFEGNEFSSLITLQAAYGGFPKVLSSEFKNNGNPSYIERSIIYTFSRSIISNNLIYNNIGTMLNGGCNGPLDSLIIEHNTVVGNTGYGFVLDHCGGGVKGYINNNIIENNTLGCLRFVSNGGGYSIIQLRNNKFNVNPYFTQNPMQYNLTWINNDTISGLTFNYPINSSSDLQLPNYSNSVGSGYSLIQAVSLTDFNGNTRPFPAGSSPDRGALENLLGSPANASPIVNPVQNIQINEDEITTIALTGIGDGDYFSSQNISISAFSDNFTLMPNPIVSYTSGSNSAILTLSPELNQSGTLTVTVALQDDGGTVNGGVDQTTITFQVTIVPVNDAPIVSDDLGSTDEETPVTINVISNDSDLDGNINPTSVTIATLPANGTATVDPLTGIVTYTPNLNFIGTDSFGYQVCDDGTPLPAECEQGTVTVTVDPVNDVPVLTADNTNTDEEIPVMIDLLTNDSDVDGNLDPETVEIIINPSNGTVTIDPVTGEATYTPNLDFNGTDAFVYQVCDDGTPLPALCSQATVTITVDPINDQPIAITLSGNTIPENQIGMIGEFSTVDIDANDNFSYTLVAGIGSNDNNLFSISGSQLSNNTTFNFEVQNTYSIRVRSTDSGGLSTEEVFSIEVLNVNDIIIDFSGGNTYCNGTEAIGWINTVVTESNGPLDYSWSGPGGFFSDEQNISGLESGQYTLTVTDDLNSQSAVTTIEVIPTYEDLAVCYVTSDSINTLRNRIYFSNPGIYNIEKYQILRESSVAGVYDLIGQVNAADTSFLDNGSDNSAVSYKYRVRSVDSCGNFSSESASHRTILLQANLGLNNTVNLNWSPYDGVSYSTYVLYKSTNGSSFEELISLPTSNTTFNDVAADVSLNTYIYYVAIPISTCDFMKVNNMIRSNEKALSPLSVNDLSQPLSVAVYPNPTFSSVTVEGEWIAGQEFVIFDLQGREVYNGRFKSIKEMIDLKNLSKGQYILRVGLNDVRITKD